MSFGGRKLWDDNWDTMEFLTTRDISYWTLLDPLTTKQKQLLTTGPLRKGYYQVVANECIRDMEKERNGTIIKPK